MRYQNISIVFILFGIIVLMNSNVIIYFRSINSYVWARFWHPLIPLCILGEAYIAIILWKFRQCYEWMFTLKACIDCTVILFTQLTHRCARCTLFAEQLVILCWVYSVCCSFLVALSSDVEKHLWFTNVIVIFLNCILNTRNCQEIHFKPCNVKIFLNFCTPVV